MEGYHKGLDWGVGYGSYNHSPRAAGGGIASSTQRTGGGVVHSPPLGGITFSWSSVGRATPAKCFIDLCAYVGPRSLS